MTILKFPFLKVLLLIIFFLLLNSVSISKAPETDPVYTETHTHSGFLGSYDDFRVMNPQT